MRETQKLVLHRPTELLLEFRYAERPAWVSCEECPELVCKLVSTWCFWHDATLPPTQAETTPDELGGDKVRIVPASTGCQPQLSLDTEGDDTPPAIRISPGPSGEATLTDGAEIVGPG